MITNVAAIHHAKILHLFDRYVERLDQTFREGASVAVVDVDEAGVQAVAKEITANSGKAKGTVADRKRTERLQASALALPTEKAYRQTESVLPDACAERQLPSCFGLTRSDAHRP